MPSSDTQRVLKTIAYHIELARRFVDGMSYDDFVADERSRYAVIRCLEIVSEASRRLPDDVKRRHSEVQWSRSLVQEMYIDMTMRMSCRVCYGRQYRIICRHSKLRQAPS